MHNKLTINFIVPGIKEHRFTGGIYCILKYADGLARKGHFINIIPFVGSKKPKWINCSANFILGNRMEKNIRNYITQKLLGRRSYFAKKAVNLDHFQNIIPPADITMATAWNTAEIVFRSGRGRKAYFMQHFEPLFFTDGDSYDKRLCEWSYLLPLEKIANSTWLQEKIIQHLKEHSMNEKVYKCVNAVDLDIYRKLETVKQRENPKHIRIISYGGRGAKWKGFEEMAQAVAIARKKLPDYNIEWIVYGKTIMPPENHIAHYIDLGFLQPHELAKAYNNADILLSASWYESFPLFPIEAMACGLAVITTQKGTEDYATHSVTAEIVEEKNPASIADGIVKLITDTEYRNNIAQNGFSAAKKFTWDRSIDTMEKILYGIMGSATLPEAGEVK